MPRPGRVVQATCLCRPRPRPDPVAAAANRRTLAPIGDNTHVTEVAHEKYSGTKARLARHFHSC